MGLAVKTPEPLLCTRSRLLTCTQSDKEPFVRNDVLSYFSKYSLLLAKDPSRVCRPLQISLESTGSKVLQLNMKFFSLVSSFGSWRVQIRLARVCELGRPQVLGKEGSCQQWVSGLWRPLLKPIGSS